MKVIAPGHTYELENFSDRNASGQILQFIHKQPKEDGSTELVTIEDGTTNEELLAVLVDRMKFLNAKFPCPENFSVITKLEKCIYLLDKRTANRKIRGVEGRATA